MNLLLIYWGFFFNKPLLDEMLSGSRIENVDGKLTYVPSDKLSLRELFKVASKHIRNPFLGLFRNVGVNN